MKNVLWVYDRVGKRFLVAHPRCALGYRYETRVNWEELQIPYRGQPWCDICGGKI